MRRLNPAVTLTSALLSAAAAVSLNPSHAQVPAGAPAPTARQAPMAPKAPCDCAQQSDGLGPSPPALAPQRARLPEVWRAPSGADPLPGSRGSDHRVVPERAARAAPGNRGRPDRGCGPPKPTTSRLSPDEGRADPGALPCRAPSPWPNPPLPANSRSVRPTASC